MRPSCERICRSETIASDARRRRPAARPATATRGPHRGGRWRGRGRAGRGRSLRSPPARAARSGSSRDRPGRAVTQVAAREPVRAAGLARRPRQTRRAAPRPARPARAGARRRRPAAPRRAPPGAWSSAVACWIPPQGGGSSGRGFAPAIVRAPGGAASWCPRPRSRARSAGRARAARRCSSGGRGARDVPGRAVVGQDQAVALERRRDHAGLIGQRRDVDARLEPTRRPIGGAYGPSSWPPRAGPGRRSAIRCTAR